MSTLADKLKKRRRDEQEIRGYANSSRWYTGLSNAISFLERAETGTDPLSRFSDAWAVAYNLFMMHGEPGDEEYRRFNSWISSVKDFPGVRHFFVTPTEPQIVSFRQSVERVKNILLKPQGMQELQSWAGKGVSPEKACRYFFTITRDIRNTAFHPGFNPTAPVKKAIGAAAECLLPIVAAAVEATIEHPVPGTTGKATAYRFFLYPFLKNSDGFFSDYYLERLFPDDELAAFPEDQSKEIFKQLAKQHDVKASALQTADGEQTHSDWLSPVLFNALSLNPLPGVRLVSDEAVFQPTCVLPKSGTSTFKASTDLKGKQAGQELSCLIWTLPWRASLDSVATEPPFVSLPVTEVAHRALAASDVPWAIITNGRQLRLLSRASSHKPRCFLEADLVALVDRRGDPQAVRAFRFLLGLFSGKCFIEQDEVGQTLLDRVAQGSDRHGKEIGDELKANVFSALQELGEGFLEYLRANPQDAAEWRDRRVPGMGKDKFLKSDVLLDEIYHESLSLMYRLLFLFYAESRELLPLDNELYQTYSLESIRDDVHSVLDDPDPKRFFAKGNTTLWARLKELFGFLDKGWGKVIPPYNGGLFDPEKHEFLERFAVGDYYLAQAIDLLSRTKPRAGQNRGEGRKKVTYRDLDVRHLGSIYEGILEYTAHIADQDYVIVRDGSGGNAFEEYTAVADLNRDQLRQFTAWKEALEENPDNPSVPRGCRVTGKVDSGQYYLAFGGRDSKRKSSGSYYTPDYIVQFIVENTLGPLVRGECRPTPTPLTSELKSIGWKEEAEKTGPLKSEEILDLKILDPAMGSGHFLVAATEYLARAYRDARLTEGGVPDEAKSEEEFVRYKRIIAERCIYGVDLNPMAVELAKLSMWLFTMDPGRPLSFLDHHLKSGNSLIGAWAAELGIDPTTAKGKPIKTPFGQQNLFEAEFRKCLPTMVQDIFRISSRETVTTQDISDKKTLDSIVESLKHPFRVIADTWTVAHSGSESSHYFDLLLHPEKANALTRPVQAKQDQYFHWEIEFPEVWFNADATARVHGGFSAVLGNPPYLRELDNKHLFAAVQAAPLGARYSSSKMNFWYYFAHRSLQVLQPSGVHSFICPAYWPLSDSSKKLSAHIRESRYVATFIDFGKNEIFEGVADRSSIYVLRAIGCASDNVTSLCVLFTDNLPSEMILKGLDALPSSTEGVVTATRRPWPKVVLGDRLHFGTDGVTGLPREGDAIQLEDLVGVVVSQGIAQNPDRLTSRNLAGAAEEYGLTVDQLTRQHGVHVGDGVFVVSEELARSFNLPKEDGGLLGPFYDAEELCLLTILPPHTKYIIYSSSETTAQITSSKPLMRHLSKYRFMMELRRETKAGTRPWWEMHWPRQRSYFTAPRLIVPQMSSRPTFMYSERPAYVNMSVNVVVCPNAATARVLWTLLNGPANVDSVIRLTKKRGTNIDLGVAGIRGIPVPRNLPWQKLIAGDPDSSGAFEPALKAFDAVQALEVALVKDLSGLLGVTKAWELLRDLGQSIDRGAVEGTVRGLVDGNKSRSAAEAVLKTGASIRSVLADAEDRLWRADAAN